MTDLFENEAMRVDISGWEAIVSQVKTLTVVIEEGAMDQAPPPPAHLPTVPEAPNGRHEALDDTNIANPSVATQQLPSIVPFQRLNIQLRLGRGAGATGGSTSGEVAAPANRSETQGGRPSVSEIAQKRNREALTSTSTRNSALRKEKPPTYSTLTTPVTPVLYDSPSEKDEEDEARPAKRLRTRSSKVRSNLSNETVPGSNTLYRRPGHLVVQMAVLPLPKRLVR